jgi:alpha-glucosidase
MKNNLRFDNYSNYSLLAIFLLVSVLVPFTTFAQSSPLVVTSPGGTHTIQFTLEDGVPMYEVNRGNTPIILPSRLGFQLRTKSLDHDFQLVDSQQSVFDETWEQPWGEVREIRDNYSLLSVTLQTIGDTPWTMIIHFRAYDDGIAYRYELPDSNPRSDIEILNEVSQFKLAADHKTWWIPAYEWNRYEYLYSGTPLSDLEIVHTPVTMETHDGFYVSIHEAALTDFASMTLRHTGNQTLQADLVPWSDGVRVRGSLPIQSPWRTIQIADKPGDLITSYLILNCNEPNKIEDTSWIKPTKYVGIWWEMHIAVSTWESGELHGATTTNTKRYIDFAAEHGFDGVLVEGWNTGWDGNWIINGDLFSFTEPYPDYDLHGLADYARGKGVRLIAHNETSVGIRNYERQIDEAYALYRSLGINAIKSGYVGHSNQIKRYDPEDVAYPSYEWHHGQWMVNHFRHVVKKAAEYQIMLDVHEPIKPTGIRRTWPNMITREGARGQEFNAWAADGGNPPDHTCIIPFTRLLAGPMDFTPGTFDLEFPESRPNNRVQTTLMKQLAIYVIVYSPMHMASDLPQNYEDQPAFQFIEDVPVDWENTIVLNANIGDYVTIARKDRNSDDWYLGSITDENPREFSVLLDFLEGGREYTAQIYADASDADWDTNPYAHVITTQKVTSDQTLEIKLAPGGGQAIRFVAE